VKETLLENFLRLVKFLVRDPTYRVVCGASESNLFSQDNY